MKGVFSMEEDMEKSEIVTESASQKEKVRGRYMTNIITICPTKECKECTGSISNELLSHTFVCMCPCHFEVDRKNGRS